MTRDTYGFWSTDGVPIVGKIPSEIFFDCKCICGEERLVRKVGLLSGRSKSCGCKGSLYPLKRVGLLTLQSKVKRGGERTKWLCKCDCGNSTEVVVGSLTTETTKSCGCLKYKVKHGHSKNTGVSGEYKSYSTMLQRCHNENSPAYKHYGGRGIKICGRWLESFENFLEDMGERPKGKTLDRVDVDGDYTPENCTWSDWKVQCFNKRKSDKNTSGRTGVQWNKAMGKWVAFISFNGVNTYLGSFDDKDCAIRAREKAEVLEYGEIKPSEKQVVVVSGI